MVAQFYKYAKNQWLICFKWLNYIVYELYLSKVFLATLKYFLQHEMRVKKGPRAFKNTLKIFLSFISTFWI